MISSAPRLAWRAPPSLSGRAYVFFFLGGLLKTKVSLIHLFKKNQKNDPAKWGRDSSTPSWRYISFSKKAGAGAENYGWDPLHWHILNLFETSRSVFLLHWAYSSPSLEDLCSLRSIGRGVASFSRSPPGHGLHPPQAGQLQLPVPPAGILRRSASGGQTRRSDDNQPFVRLTPSIFVLVHGGLFRI